MTGMRRPTRVLVIDSEDIVLNSVVRALEDSKHPACEVTTANSAVDGLKLVREKIFDVILIDVSLPGVNGAELLRRIKSTNPSIYVIVMTGYTLDKALLTEVSKNADGFLLKPFTIGEIKSALSSILKSSA